MITARKPAHRPPTRLLSVAAANANIKGVCWKNVQNACVSTRAHAMLPPATISHSGHPFRGFVRRKDIAAPAGLTIADLICVEILHEPGSRLFMQLQSGRRQIW